MTAGVSPVRSGTSVSMWPASPAGSPSIVVPSGAITWLVPTVERFTTERPVSIARIRANASCCRFSSVPRKSALLVWNM